ncbi:MAG: 50S ribosomal protein L29 [Xanthomonadaceae bacterium]|nr:50S ribosomal protein L29 [Xanthomonadaceae bacterium]
MKASEVRTKSTQELRDMLVALRKRQFELRMQMGTGQLNELHQLREVRRDIARVKTVINSAQGSES